MVSAAGALLEDDFEVWLIDHYLDLWEDWMADAKDWEALWDWAEVEHIDVLLEFKQLCKQEETNVSGTTETG